MLNQNNYKESVYFKRRSIRKFKLDPIEDWKVDAIIKGIFQTPSAKNQMPWEIIKVTNKDTLNQLSQYHHSGDIFKQVPLALIITSVEDYTILPTGKLSDQDLGAISLQTLLIATELGLGSLWCAIHPNKEREEPFKKVLNIPDSVKVFSIILIGYSDESKESNDKYFPNKIHHDKW